MFAVSIAPDGVEAVERELPVHLGEVGVNSVGAFTVLLESFPKRKTSSLEIVTTPTSVRACQAAST